MTSYTTRSKGQSAIEYLMTYGWMLLVVAIVGGAVFSVMGDQTIESTSGFIGSDVAVDNFGVTDSGDIQMEMRNQDSSEIEIKGINISNGDRFTEWRPVEGVGKSIGVGDAESVTLYNIERTDSSNALDIKITYDTENLENLSLSGTISGDLGIAKPKSYIYNSDILGFENLEPWNLEYAEQSEERTLSEKSLYTTGSYKGLQASINISRKGIRPKAFKYSYNEPGASGGRGAGIRLYDSEDGYLGGTATDNAQIRADFIDSNNPGNWGGYNNWITVKWDFNWSEGTADVTWSRPDGNEITSGKFELYRSTNVSTIELWNYNGGSWGGGRQETWWDNIRVIN